MTLYKGRERFSGLSVKVGTAFSALGLSPNQWTVLTLLPAIASVYFLTMQDFLAAAGLFIIASFIDLIDGSVARVTGRVTRFGAYLDTIIDRYVEALVVFGLLFVGLPRLGLLPAPWDFPTEAWLFLYFFGGMMTTYAKAAAKEKNIFQEKDLRGGLLERAERLIILFFGLLLAHFDPWYLSVIIAILALLANISAVQRIWIARAESLRQKG